MAKHNITGSNGEKLAINYLRKLSYLILNSNFKTKLGEIDIVAKDGDQYVFVEVKTRSSIKFGTPAQAITHRKLLSLVKNSEYYLQIHNYERNYRIDAIEVTMSGEKVLSINHIKNISL